ncbi:glycine betaine ABC transporter substrate-binding protein [Tuberibacillus sp. Marseille-P3662]|uniref:glycine betaine ABC transporter substrate-binding protein n=1 Tax=Tuberibacillus sp. Marseille-P3662 TaxID=1965358 RepID=UPI001593AA47|nr:glycine betaine ABC transporter substrate-binding protein [Tuberibacillus sp. Marseille-P3662]
MKLSQLFLLSIAFILFLAGCNANNEQKEDSKQNETNKKTITIGLDPYNYATMPAYLSKVILEQKGYNVKIQNGQVGILYTALSQGEIDAFIDIWTPNLQQNYLKKYKGDFDIIGTLYSDTPLGIAVPKYMTNINSINDLKKHKKQFEGKIYAIDKGSGMALTTKKMVKKYNMDFDITNTSTPAMVAQAKKTINNKEAIAFNAWRPHVMFKQLDIKMLKDPKNVWKSDDVKIGVVPNLKENAPKAYTLFSNMKLKIPSIEDWLMAMSEGKKPKQLAEKWVEEHPDKVDQWLTQSK